MIEDLARYYYDDGIRLAVDIPRVGKKRGEEVWSCKIGHKQISAATLVWYLHHGTWEVDLDHIDRNPKNNRLENLRKSTRSFQVVNTRARGKLPKGVTRNHNNYAAQTKLNGMPKYLGTFKTPEEAHQAYVDFWAAEGFTGPTWGEVGDD